MVIVMSGVEENLNNPDEQLREESMEVLGYEQCREERIKENLERMQKLGILDLSLKLKSLKSTPKRPSPRRTPQSHSHSVLPPSGPVRRSSRVFRLQNSTPISYSEVHLTKKDKFAEDDVLLREEGSKPEIYTNEHEKLLGSTEMSWTLFVDGYGEDGKRIYDPVRGKTCHQCRQKTLGHRTHCSKCNLVQGQFCGDCLYMRYGENVLEANKNPNWICPVCRGICNCSLCRQGKGWPPTGSLYRKISSLGYKSVAHYLIQTRRAETDSNKNVSTKVPVSAKRSLPFSEVEVTAVEDDLSKSNRENLDNDPASKVDATGDDLNNKITDGTLSKQEFTNDKVAPDTEAAEPLLEPAAAPQSAEDQVKYALESKTEKFNSVYDEKIEADFLMDHHKLDESCKATSGKPLRDPILTESSHHNQPITLERGDDNDTKRNDAIIQDNVNLFAPEKSPKLTEKCVVIAPTPDSIAGRLRQRPNKRNATEELSCGNNFTRNAEDIITKESDSTLGSSTQRDNSSNTNKESGSINSEYSETNASSTPDVDSIARRLKMRRRA